MIWLSYLHDKDDGSCRINIDNRTKQECQQSLIKDPNVNVFEKVQLQIFQLMKYDSYPRFLKSDVYKNYIRNEMENKSIQQSKDQISKRNEERSTNYV